MDMAVGDTALLTVYGTSDMLVHTTSVASMESGAAGASALAARDIHQNIRRDDTAIEADPINQSGLVLDNCTSDAVEQTVTAYCHPNASPDCAAILASLSPGAIVILPDTCAGGYVAHVAAMADAGNGAFNVTLDFDWASATASRRRDDAAPTVSFTIAAAGDNSGALARRSFLSSIKKIINKIVDANNVSDTIGASNTGLISLTAILASGTGTCLSGITSESASLNATLTATMNTYYSLAVAGTIIPPALTAAGGSFGGSITGTTVGLELSMNAALSDTVTLLDVIAPVPYASLSVPAVFSAGLMAGVDASVTAAIQANLAAKASVGLPINPAFGLSFSYTPADGLKTYSNASLNTMDAVLINPVASAVGSVTGTLTGAVTPKVYLGINVLSGVLDAQVGLKLPLTTTLAANATAGATVAASGASAAASAGISMTAGIALDAYATGSLLSVALPAYTYPIFSFSKQLFSVAASADTSVRFRSATTIATSTTPTTTAVAMKRELNRRSITYTTNNITLMAGPIFNLSPLLTCAASTAASVTP
ncbi:hypothetical protein HDU84_007316 [Entophlyctis sp. JEL0112]|nr:hypothetical protein HDU84_007316 [Entophlyctis sp. JEL0112]